MLIGMHNVCYEGVILSKHFYPMHVEFVFLNMLLCLVTDQTGCPYLQYSGSGRNN